MKRVLPMLLLVILGLVLIQHSATPQVNEVKQLAPGVYFHEGDLLGKHHCNNGWVIFDDYVVVIDANFPSGAQEVIPKIRAQTSKPIRFVFDTHHHGDHAYGNQIWVDSGATPVSQEGVVEEMKKYESGYYGGKPGRWEQAAAEREDVKNSRLKPPTLLYRDLMIFDDGKHRVELLWFGVGHTRGDGFAWLPKEKILFTGDMCVNGPYNFMGDGDSAEWIETLTRAQMLGATAIAPGHGPLADGNLLEEQKQFFIALRAEVGKIRTKPPEQAQKQVENIRQSLLPKHAKYIDPSPKALIPFESQVAQVYKEMSGKEFPGKTAMERARQVHAWFHGLAEIDARRSR